MQDRIVILREKTVKVTQLLTGMGIEVTQRGVQAYVSSDKDGKPLRVNLPYLPDDASQDLMDAIEGFLDHEVAHILFTDFKLFQVSKKAGFQAMHNILEDTLIERLMAQKFKGSGSNLATTGRFFLQHFTLPELNKAIAANDEQMIQGILMVPMFRALSGQQVFREFMDKGGYWPRMQQLLDTLGDLVHEVPKCRTTADTLALAEKVKKAMNAAKEHAAKEREKAKRKKEAKKSKSEPKDAGGEGEPEQPGDGTTTGEPDAEDTGSEPEDAAGAGEEESGASDKGEDADDADGPAQGDAAPGDGEPGDGEEAEAENTGEAAGDPEMDTGDEAGTEAGEDGGLGADSGDDLATGDASDHGEGMGEGEGATASGEDSGEDSEGEMTDATAFDPDLLDLDGMNDFDAAMTRILTNESVDAAKSGKPYLPFTKDHDIIEPLKVPLRHYRDDMLVKLDKETGHLVAPLQKDLERAITARSLSTWQPGLRSGRLHAANLSRLAVGDARVFRKKQVNESKDVAVELVVDMSGSMGGRKIHLAAQAAYALSTVLERIGISYEVVGFTTGKEDCRYEAKADEARMGRRFSRYENIYMPVFKSFGERLNAETKKRFAWAPHFGALGNNVDGESLEMAAVRLLQRREKGKIMIVLSDGQPAFECGEGYAAGIGDRHLKQTVKDLEKRGIKMVGIGILTEAVKSYYPRHVVISEVSDLPGTVMRQLKQMLVG